MKLLTLLVETLTDTVKTQMVLESSKVNTELFCLTQELKLLHTELLLRLDMLLKLDTKALLLLLYLKNLWPNPNTNQLNK